MSSNRNLPVHPDLANFLRRHVPDVTPAEINAIGYQIQGIVGRKLSQGQELAFARRDPITGRISLKFVSIGLDS